MELPPGCMRGKGIRQAAALGIELAPEALMIAAKMAEERKASASVDIAGTCAEW